MLIKVTDASGDKTAFIPLRSIVSVAISRHPTLFITATVLTGETFEMDFDDEMTLSDFLKRLDAVDNAALSIAVSSSTSETSLEVRDAKPRRGE